MMKNKLLLVNDEEALQEIFASFLVETGWQTEAALDGNQALRMYRKRGPYDLVLTDIMHPSLDGIEVVKRIRERNPQQAIAVVAACSMSNQMAALDAESLSMETLLQETQSSVIDLVGAWQRGGVQQRQRAGFKPVSRGLRFSQETLFFEPGNVLLMNMMREMNAEIVGRKNIGAGDGI
jgi:CheY-like chemotaxis protein